MKKNWCIQGCEELHEWICKWDKTKGNKRISVGGYDSNNYYYPSQFKELGGRWGYSDTPDYPVITFEEFERIVLNKEPEIVTNYEIF